MKVVVVGAGIGGLGAAIALNRAGHDVEVYESSAFLNEVGAAIHLAPNATRVLQGWDFDFDPLLPVDCEGSKLYSKDFVPLGPPMSVKDAREAGIQEPWLLVHRVDLHNALREHAERGFNGRPVKIHVNSKIDSVNAETGEVYFQDGRTIRGDLVVGADGLHSRTVQAIISNGRDKIITGQNAFRFLVPLEKAVLNPSVKRLVEEIGLHHNIIIVGARERLVIYPCRSGKLLNCAFIYDDDVKDAATASESSWLNAGSVDDLLRRVNGFGEGIPELCAMAEDLKLWSLVTRDPPPTYVKGRLALIGDAAHPMLPHQGQGGGQALEDAAALGALFTTKNGSDASAVADQVSELLSIYNQVRYDHTVTICITSRVSFDRRGETLADLQRFIPGATIDLTSRPLHSTWSSRPDVEVARLLALRREGRSLM